MISATHYEHQPHKWAFAWTVSRSHGNSAGGHFYIACYGIRVESAPNTLVAWMPNDSHGTTLQACRPADDDPSFYQKGLSFVTSNRLKTVWRNYQDKLISWAEAMDSLYGPGVAGDEIFE
jgi:hypothetical protein